MLGGMGGIGFKGGIKDSIGGGGIMVSFKGGNASGTGFKGGIWAASVWLLAVMLIQPGNGESGIRLHPPTQASQASGEVPASSPAARRQAVCPVARSASRNESYPAEALIIMAGHDWSKPHQHRRSSRGVCTSKFAGCPDGRRTVRWWPGQTSGMRTALRRH